MVLKNVIRIVLITYHHEMLLFVICRKEKEKSKKTMPKFHTPSFVKLEIGKHGN